MVDVVPLCPVDPCMHASLAQSKCLDTPQCTWGSGGVPHSHTFGAQCRA